MNKNKDNAILRNINAKIHNYMFRHDIWINNFGKVFEIKCPTSWCENIINPFEFNMGFRKPLTLRESKLMEKEKLIPLCRRCACSMNNKMTFVEWNKKYQMIKLERENKVLLNPSVPENKVLLNPSVPELKPLIPTINILPDELEYSISNIPNVNIYKAKKNQEHKKNGLVTLVKLFKIF